ncbi:MAG: HNH endonuclease [bacterium]
MKESTKKKISKAMMGKKNPMYKDGRRSYRRIAGAKTGDEKIVHHKDGNRKNNKKSNLTIISKKDRGKHDKAHRRGKNFKKSGGTKKKAYKKKSNPKRIK